MAYLANSGHYLPARSRVASHPQILSLVVAASLPCLLTEVLIANIVKIPLSCRVLVAVATVVLLWAHLDDILLHFADLADEVMVFLV